MAAKPIPKQSSANIVQQCFEAHNKYRGMHGCPPLKLDKKLSSFATEWAQNLARRDAMEHRSNNKYGENIYFSAGQNINGEMPVKRWYDEISNYDFDKAEFRPQNGHFTQLIWKGSKEVGIGIAEKKDKVWVVANYNPPGNVLGTFKENIPKKIK